MQQLTDLGVSIIYLRNIKTKCQDEKFQYCLFKSVHQNIVIPVINYYCLHTLDDVIRLNFLVDSNSLDTYIEVLTTLHKRLLSIFK